MSTLNVTFTFPCFHLQVSCHGMKFTKKIMHELHEMKWNEMEKGETYCLSAVLYNCKIES